MVKNGYLRSSYDNCVYLKWLENGVGIFLLLYIDDMLIASVNHLEIVKQKKLLGSEIEMKDLGKAKRILGMQIERNEDHNVLKISQKSYLYRVLNRFGMKDAKPVMTPIAHHFKLFVKQCPTTSEEILFMSKTPYTSAIGCLMYSMICTRLDLAYATSLISKFMSNLGKEH